MSKKKNNIKKNNDDVVEKFQLIKPSWKEIGEDLLRYFTVYTITAIILIILIKYF